MFTSFSSDIYEVLVFAYLQLDKNIKNYQQNMKVFNTSTICVF